MKNFSKIYILFVLIGSLSAQEKPNILWITIEDTSPHFVGCYGNNNASTPNIDKLANEGIRFTNAFATGTVCSASRSAIITGVPTYKLGTGNHRSTHKIPSEIKGFPVYLREVGYYTSNNVKTDYNIASATNFTAAAWNDSSSTASWSKRSTASQPFFSVFNFGDSHQSRTMTFSYDWYVTNVFNNLSQNERTGDNEFDMPPFYKDSPEMRKQFARVYNSITLTDKKIGDLLQQLENDGLADDTIIFFYADHEEGMPRGKSNGINYGYRVPFIVKFPEKYKHLSPWGGTGSVTDELISFEDLAPTIINLANGNVPDYLKGRTLIGDNRSAKRDHLLLSADRTDNGPDLVRTVTDGRYIYTRNFMPFMPEVRYINYFEIGDISKQMRADYKNNQLNKVQKSILEKRPLEMLYDIENDLWETNNLVDDPNYSSILTTIRAKLDQSILEAKDIHFMPELEMKQISNGSTTLYDYRQSSSSYPFETIYKVASLSGKKGDEIAKQQSDFLNKTNKVVRYWAALGLLSQDTEVVAPYTSELTNKLNDSYSPTKITAAAVLYDKFSHETSKNLLISFIDNFSFYRTLMTLNYITYIKNKTPFVAAVENLLNRNNLNGIIRGACLDFLSSVENDVSLSISDYTQEDFKLYPLPFSTSTNFKFPRKLVNGNLIIYNSLGVEVKKYKNINSIELKIIKGNLNSGVYFYNLKENDIRLTTGKLVIN
ncbi:sulfatase-like hydrolase/transferase [Polaribacter porphyrae]|uniref:Sulfatase N-terminal domain-containing protein n=1 Tax=Polaribacter porphyrae TaxID=1137780 RepID=A0A2S7WPR3_9FLAO|nr:sulfatase-like hydrolase/transferase [Polaribacter porphyrae]PQJ79608.1 hypothetical protein BTO18_10680 [Polaribacter porphyrae]